MFYESADIFREGFKVYEKKIGLGWINVGKSSWDETAGHRCTFTTVGKTDLQSELALATLICQGIVCIASGFIRRTVRHIFYDLFFSEIRT